MQNAPIASSASHRQSAPWHLGKREGDVYQGVAKSFRRVGIFPREETDNGF